MNKAAKNINISFRTSNMLNNILNNKIEHFNIYDSKGIYQLTRINYEKFYIGILKQDLKNTKKILFAAKDVPISLLT